MKEQVSKRVSVPKRKQWLVTETEPRKKKEKN